MTLEGLIETLEGLSDSTAIVMMQGRNIGGLVSYRGYYEQLALTPDGPVYGSEPRTVGSLLTECREAIGKTFQGYKGGDFVMGKMTPVWAAEASQCPGDAIIGVSLKKGIVELQTVDISDYA